MVSSYAQCTSQESVISDCCLTSFRGKVIGDKVYLHPEIVQIGSNGIIVPINDELVPVPAIEFDG